MLLGSLTLSVILITVGFQTASALVMAKANRHLLRFYIHIESGALTWTRRDNHLGAGVYRLWESKDKELFVAEGTGPRKVYTEPPVLTDQRAASPPKMGPALEWSDIEHSLHLYWSQLVVSRGQGWVYYQPTENPSVEIQERPRPITGPEIWDEQQSPSPITGPEIWENQENPSPITGPEIGEQHPTWVKIEYTAYKNQRDRSESHSADPPITVGGLEVFFYCGQDGGLSLISRNEVNNRWNHDQFLVPLSPRDHFYVDKESGSRRVYLSPYDTQDPSWDPIYMNLYVDKDLFREHSMGDVIEVPFEERSAVPLNNYLKVHFGGEGSPIPHAGSSPLAAELAQHKKASTNFLGRLCCAGSKVLE